MGELREVEAATDLQQLKDELRYCLENGMYGPRTGVALQWALEALEEMEPPPIIQCDGCQIGAPINEYGHHRYSDGSLMGCTRERYEQTSEEQK